MYCNEWKIESLNKPKLCTYVKFKTCFKIEDHVMSFMSHQQRSYLAQLSSGILPLDIETGRWYGVREEDRIYKAGNKNQIENENHFIFHCNAYSTLRTTFDHPICNVMPTFTDINDEDKLNILMNKEHANNLLGIYDIHLQNKTRNSIERKCLTDEHSLIYMQVIQCELVVSHFGIILYKICSCLI